MATITIQFKGICCHIAPPTAFVPRRSVLPMVHDHVSYIEVFTNDVVETANPDFTFSTPYTRENGSYQFVQVNDAKIELLNITSSTFSVTKSYDQRIPKLRDVEPRFTAVKPSLLQPQIASGEVAAYFDITVGELSAGASQYFRTVFDPQRNWPVRHLGQWVQLDVEVSGSVPVLRVTSLADNTQRLLTLRDGADLITIGNQTLFDIQGIPGMSGHFVHFYDLSDTTLTAPLPAPKNSAGLGIGCSDTNWP